MKLPSSQSFRCYTAGLQKTSRICFSYLDFRAGDDDRDDTEERRDDFELDLARRLSTTFSTSGSNLTSPCLYFSISSSVSLVKTSRNGLSMGGILGYFFGGSFDFDVDEVLSFDLDVDVDEVLSLVLTSSVGLGFLSFDDDLVFDDDDVVFDADDVMREEMTLPSSGFRAVLDFMIFILSAFKLKFKNYYYTQLLMSGFVPCHMRRC